MKKLSIINILIASALLFNACEEIEKEPLTSDSQAPQPILSPVVENEPGGATITYNLPDETDLLYVKAEYTLSDGEQYETRSSIYSNAVKVEGYGDTNEHTVTLYTVDRSENVSDPVNITIQPLTPDVHSVQQTIEMVPAFGGVQYTWKNPNNAPLSFLILASDSTGAIFPVDVVYSSIASGQYTLRGYEPEERNFGIVIRDRWDNFSDSVRMNMTPMFEEKLDKEKFNRIVLPGDADMDAWGMRYEWMYDDNLNTISHTYAGTGWPQYFTLDLGITAKLSRFILFQRQDGGYAYGHGNPRILEIWGTAEGPPADGSWEGWTKIRDYVASRPSEEGGTAEEDQEHFESGDEYAFTLEDPPVRYIRIVVNETWGLTGFIHIAEITLYGQVISE
ncbi:protein of unknown function [Tangfeifania diversioriginum]|uniref:F5/8 type C domain-containing protein n=1 Tax=Tangfeifania diversioriginum TaxID=1168035 RepID=A0A1M6H2S3_9BACT|nr:DUF4959 domain-containing protein [Tangfeifania diversioriginum]SHJ16497.1 protein of unknown function [Tangfeifania diversioriginum]